MNNQNWVDGYFCACNPGKHNRGTDCWNLTIDDRFRCLGCKRLRLPSPAGSYKRLGLTMVVMAFPLGTQDLRVSLTTGLSESG